MKKKCFVAVAALAMGIIIGKMSNIESYAETGEPSGENESIHIGVNSVNAPENVLNYLREVASDIVLEELQDPEAFGIQDVSRSDIQVMEPYMLHVEGDDGQYESSGIYAFPVVSSGKVMFTIDVFEWEGELLYSLSNELTEELTELVNVETSCEIYTDHGENFEKCDFLFVSDQTEMQELEGRAVEMGEDHLNVLLDLSDASEFEEITVIENEPDLVPRISYPTQGFSVNNSTTKRLNMSNCLVSQSNYSCGIPCIATLYRYRTATHTMTAESLNALNNQYGYNIETTAGQV